MSRQREVIYAERRRVLEGADLGEQIRGFLDDVIPGGRVGAARRAIATFHWPDDVVESIPHDSPAAPSSRSEGPQQ